MTVMVPAPKTVEARPSVEARSRSATVTPASNCCVGVPTPSAADSTSVPVKTPAVNPVLLPEVVTVGASLRAAIVRSTVTAAAVTLDSPTVVVVSQVSGEAAAVV